MPKAVSDLSKILSFIEVPTEPPLLLEAQRLFHGRGHAYEGLYHITIDWLPPVILITLFAPEPTQSINKLSDQLLTLFPRCQSVQLQHRYKLSGPISIIHGEDIQQLVICENKLQYQIQLGKSRNTGLFLDMKNGRNWVQKHSKGKNVLNLFAYTCGFSIAAIAGDAKSVFNVDMSSPALNIGRNNHRLNQQSLDSVNFDKLNIMKSFGRLKKRGPFDLLICDPPTFQKGSVDIAKDYPKIMRRLNEFMSPKSTLMLCLNAPELGRSFLIDNMKEYAPQYQYIQEIKPPQVFAEVENKGLKILIFNNTQH